MKHFGFVHAVNKRAWRKDNHVWNMCVGRGLGPPSIVS